MQDTHFLFFFPFFFSVYSSKSPVTKGLIDQSLIYLCPVSFRVLSQGEFQKEPFWKKSKVMLRSLKSYTDFA